MDTSTHEVLRGLLKKEKTIIVKEALANGRLLRNKNYPRYEPLYKMLDEIASGYGVGTDAIALRFVMDHLKPSLVLSGAATKQQLEANLKALNIQLSPEEIASLKKIHIEAETYWLERKQLSWN